MVVVAGETYLLFPGRFRVGPPDGREKIAKPLDESGLLREKSSPLLNLLESDDGIQLASNEHTHHTSLGQQQRGSNFPRCRLQIALLSKTSSTKLASLEAALFTPHSLLDGLILRLSSVRSCAATCRQKSLRKKGNSQLVKETENLGNYL